MFLKNQSLRKNRCGSYESGSVRERILCTGSLVSLQSDAHFKNAEFAEFRRWIDCVAPSIPPVPDFLDISRAWQVKHLLQFRRTGGEQVLRHQRQFDFFQYSWPGLGNLLKKSLGTLLCIIAGPTHVWVWGYKILTIPQSIGLTMRRKIFQACLRFSWGPVEFSVQKNYFFDSCVLYSQKVGKNSIGNAYGQGIL